MEAAADVIAHAAERHRAQRVGRHRQRRLRRRPPAAVRRAYSRSRNSSSDGRGNFGASPKPPCRAIEGRLDTARPRSSSASAPATRRFAAAVPSAPVTDLQPLEQLRRGLLDARAIVLPHARELGQQIGEPRPAPARRRREVGAAEERLQLRRQEHRHRPAARSRRRLHERHVDAIDVGPLLAIDLDRHEVGVQERRRSSAFSNDSCSMTWHQWHVE